MTLEKIECGWPQRQPGKIPVHFCGLISGVGGIKDEVYCRELQCYYCGQTKWKMEFLGVQEENEICCAEQALDPNYEERKQSRSHSPCSYPL